MQNVINTVTISHERGKLNSIAKMNIRKIFIGFFLFFYLYLPPFLSFNTIIIVGLISWLLLLVFRVHLLKGPVTIVASILLFSCAYILIVGFIKQNEFVNSMGGLAYLTIFGFPSALFIATFAKKSKISFDEFLSILIFVAFVQGLLSILTYINSNIHSFFVDRLFYSMSEEQIPNLITVRLFGWSNGLTYAMPILQSVIGMLSIFKGVFSKKRINYLYAAIIMFSGLINARTSLVIIIMGFVLLLFFTFLKSPKKCFKLLLVIIALLFLFNSFLSISKNSNNIKWISDGIEEIAAFLEGKKEGYFDALFTNDAIGIGIHYAPTGSELWFGTGLLVRSDIGYIRDLWEGGIIYCLLVYFSFFMMTTRIARNLFNSTNKIYAFFLFFLLTSALVVTNIKGSIFGVNEFSMFIVLIFIFLESNNVNNKKRRLLSESR
ncbi:hypothetical protein J6Y73_03325 [bacterium]|nr:hypothetical protein [bacterium]